MKRKFETIIRHIIDSEKGIEPLLKVDVPEQFRHGEDDNIASARNLNAAFLIALSGDTHPLFNRAVEYLNGFRSHPACGNIASFYRGGLELIRSELSQRYSSDERFKKDLLSLYAWVNDTEKCENHAKTIEKIRSVFFPEGVSLSSIQNRQEKIKVLREKRKIRISRLNPLPITNPAREILFTSNILFTIPPVSKGIESVRVSNNLKRMLKQIAQEEQMYWYDHPVPIGVAPEHNEVLYGLEGLDETINFEKKHGTATQNDRLDCILSASVTHKGLQGIIKEYLEDEFKNGKNIKNLNVFIFTERDTIQLVDEILVPAAQRYMRSKDYGLLYETIGVDGEYGRHYSFLKAISAFWHVFIDPNIKGTFKIDLDQVFPQKELVGQSGSSAFEHLKTPLWGAEGIDTGGRRIELGMIAGALVNRKDIEHSLFTPDVHFPDTNVQADELIFFSTLPQALSTEAEMMTRYAHDTLDGAKQCIQRIHVTGGTCGILIDSLRKHRPFTPSFIGRAEDQAYVLSILFNDSQKNLRYVHKDGLIMRHDKEAFAGEAIKRAAMGKIIGDYIRILLFSYYTDALPWSFEDIKNAIDPFTGCFVSRIPLTVVYLSLALKTASFFNGKTGEKNKQGFEFVQMGTRRLHETIQKLVRKPNPLIEHFLREKQGWNLYYDILDTIERDLKKGDAFAIALQEKAQSLVKGCKIV
ncbi:MAG: hypothetical protein KAJ59_01055 [Thermodesulfovibrionia bacterium]|nr:hypothetical protein [Thermodesulfovibrionia bacterium]